VASCPICGRNGEACFNGFACTNPDCQNFDMGASAEPVKPTQGPIERPTVPSWLDDDEDDWSPWADMREHITGGEHEW